MWNIGAITMARLPNLVGLSMAALSTTLPLGCVDFSCNPLSRAVSRFSSSVRIFITRFGGALPRSVKRARIQGNAREILFHRGEPGAIAKLVIDNTFCDRQIRALGCCVTSRSTRMKIAWKCFVARLFHEFLVRNFQIWAKKKKVYANRILEFTIYLTKWWCIKLQSTIQSRDNSPAYWLVLSRYSRGCFDFFAKPFVSRLSLHWKSCNLNTTLITLCSARDMYIEREAYLFSRCSHIRREHSLAPVYGIPSEIPLFFRPLESAGCWRVDRKFSACRGGARSFLLFLLLTFHHSTSFSAWRHVKSILAMRN